MFMNEESKAPMRILLITSWSTACGIATYSANLVEQLEAQGVQVEIYSNTTDYLGLVKLARESHCDVVHIQHEYGISLPLDGLMSVISKFETRGIPVVITTHTEDDGANVMLDGVPSAIILHNDKKDLAKKKMFSMFARIPHGIPEIVFEESSETYREKYGIPKDAFVIGTCGFMSQDRGQMLETITQTLLTLNKTDTRKIYLHFVMSAHRNDAGAQFANLIKATILNLATQLGMTTQVQVNTDFIPTHEFRDRIRTFDLGFSWANPKAQSNSGSAADIISCGVPIVVNDVPHFKNLAPFCTVVEGGTSEIAQQLYDLFKSDTKDKGATLARLGGLACQAIAELGYSRMAKQHITLYHLLASKTSNVLDFTPATGSRPLPTLNKELPITVTVPNLLWQIPVLWTKLQALIDNGHSVRLLVQNDGLTDIATLKWVLPGLVDIQFADVGLDHDPRLVRLQSLSVAQNMTLDLNAWFTGGRTYGEFLPQLSSQLTRLKLGEYAVRAAQRYNITKDTVLVIASEAAYTQLQTQPLYLGDCVTILSTPLNEVWAHKLNALLKARVIVEDFRTVWACCQRAGNVFTEFGAAAVIAALADVPVILPPDIRPAQWQLHLLHSLRQLVNSKAVGESLEATHG